MFSIKRINIYMRYCFFFFFFCRCADETNKIFGPAILLQYIASSMVLCMCVYQLGQIKSFDLQLLSTIVYTSAMFLEIFLVCLAGTELTEEVKSFNF